MPHDDRKAGSAIDWLARAKGDLGRPYPVIGYDFPRAPRVPRGKYFVGGNHKCSRIKPCS